MARLTGLDQLFFAERTLLDMPKLMSQATRDAAEELEDVIDACFELGVDPYGHPWQPLAPSTIARGRNNPPGTDDGALRAVYVAPKQYAGITVEFDVSYATYFSFRRPLTPDYLPFEQSIWYESAVTAYSNAFRHDGGWRVAGGTAK